MSTTTHRQNYHDRGGAHCQSKPVLGTKIGFGTEPIKMNKAKCSKFNYRREDTTNLHYQSNYGGMNK